MRTNRAVLLAYATLATLGLMAAASTAAEARPCMLGGMSKMSKGFGMRMSMPGQGYASGMPKPRKAATYQKASPKPAKAYAASAKQKPAPAKPASSQLASAPPTKPASVAAATIPPPSQPATCLAKEYLDTGAVKFRDTCTGEWAVNTTHLVKPAAAGPANCFKKDNHQQGIVLFRDVCTNEWAMNTEQRQAQGL